jgi:dTDP-D-glucose 4,6-dehydratase
LVCACHHTYGLPTLTTNGSNNYGPYKLPEKLIPLMIQRNAPAAEPLPVYGDGMNVREGCTYWTTAARYGRFWHTVASAKRITSVATARGIA